MGPTTHSKLGASSAHRWLSCPGSVRLSVGIPRTSSVYADEGTAAHELAETCLRSGIPAAHHIGTRITVGETAFEVSEEMAAAVQVYLDTVSADFTATKGGTMAVESRFHLDWLYDGLFGTNDAMVGEPFGVLRVYDYKHGAGYAVEAEDNCQMMYYALGAAHGDAYEEVELVIVQPRASHPDGPVRRCRMPIDQLNRWAQEVLLPGAIATEADDAPVHAGSHCKFCPARAICPAQKELAMSVAKEVFADKPKALPAPTALAITDLKRILDASEMIESWLGACRDYAKTMLETGQATPDMIGYKLVAGRASRKWTDEADAEKWLVTILDQEAYTKKLLSPSQAEKLLKGAAKKALEPLVTITRGSQLAPASDKREALPPGMTAFIE